MEKEEKRLINKCRIIFVIMLGLGFLDPVFLANITVGLLDPICIVAIFTISFISAEEKNIWYTSAYILIGSMVFTIFYYFYAVDHYKRLGFSNKQISFYLFCGFYSVILFCFSLISIIKNYRLRKSAKQ